MIQFQSLARDVEIGANSYLLTLGEIRILLDAGMHPKREGENALPDLGEIDYGSIHAAILSHAHLDHSGAMPVVQRSHPDMPVFMSPATCVLTEALLHNSVNVMNHKREQTGNMDYPLFTHREIGQISKKWQARKPGRCFNLDRSGNTTCQFHEAGHVMGAVSSLICSEGRTILYSGDLHFEDQTIIKGALLPQSGVDVLILETTRGAVARAPEYTRNSEGERLASSIEQCLSQGGSVMIPLFAMGKTQEIITLLHELQMKGKIRTMPFHVGGLSIKMTGIYDRFTSKVRRNHHGMHMMRTKGLLNTPGKRGEMPALEPGNIYALSSGMMSERTMSNRLGRQFIQNPRNLVAAVGYADPESPLAKVINSSRGEKVQLDDRHDAVERNCSVENFDFSAHAPREDLVEYVETLKPEMTILVHGDQPAVDWMKQDLETRVPETEVIIATPKHEIIIG
ncbi:MAG: MBL fold metallo-hydrolase [Verrucomicrobiaceae bacterium]|nr:MBL fold metallo-hydrolase [Verrucomicrobiaceae bacterium]